MTLKAVQKGQAMDYKQKFYPEVKFGGFSDVDGTIAFFNRVNALLQPSFTVLDVGCGRGARSEDPVLFRKGLCNLKGKVSKVIGIDVDPNAQNNPFLTSFAQYKEAVGRLKAIPLT